MKFIEKKLKSQTVFSGKVVTLEVDNVLLPNGKNGMRECVRHSGGAAVLLVKDGKVLLVKQFRYPYGKEIYEIPAGKLNKGEDPLKAAERELEEETGFRAKLVHSLDIYPSPGYTDEIIHIYFANDVYDGKLNPDDDEFIIHEFVDFDTVIKMIESGEICDSKTVAAVYKYKCENNL
ncbi:MAG: NUDIX hydrolase [Clostridia bacterium]|nr:NUDIX hydrolase [Clostridia bacterium]